MHAPEHLFNLLPLLIGTWGMVAAAAVSIGGSVLSANGAKSAASKAADANAKNVADTNAANLNLFNLSRGGINPATGYGNAILPQYFGGNEQAMGQAAYDNFNKITGAGANNYDSLMNYQNQLGGSLGNAFTALGNRYNGADLAQRVGFANPYYAARTGQAQTYGQGYRDIAAANTSGINTGLAQAISAMNAQRAAQGFVGNSTFDRNRAMAATIGARQQAGVMNAQANAQGNNLMADANLANAGDLRTLQTQNQDFMSNPAALAQAMGSAGDFYNAPAIASSNLFNAGLQPLNYFRINPQAFQQQNLPQVTPQINNNQIWGSVVSQLGQAAGGYFGGQALLGGGGAGAGLNPYTNPTNVQNTGLAQGYNFNPPSSSFMNFNPGGSQGPFNYHF